MFYPYIGFNPKGRSDKSWRRNLKVLFDWGTIEWNTKDNCVRFRFDHPKSVISVLRRTLVLPEQYTGKRDEFFSHLEELMTSSRICGYNVIFPLGTEDRLWDWLDEKEVENQEDFEDLIEKIKKEFGHLPYTSITISQDTLDRVNKLLKNTKCWYDETDFIEEAINDKLNQLKKKSSTSIK